MGTKFVFRIAQEADGTIYATTRTGGGLWRSRDGGDSWENVGDPAWGSRNTWGLDVAGGRVLVSVEGLGIYYAETNPLSGLNPVVFLPGFLGSWSYKGLIENQPTLPADWQLFPYFTETFYQPLLQTLKNAGLADTDPNKSLFTFAYDFRQPVADTAALLYAYLTSEVQPRHPGKKINIVAHSLGSLVARYCSEKIPGCADKIGKIATAGGPHAGAIKAYELWEGGQFMEENVLLKSALEIALHSAGFPYLSDKDIVQNRLPSVKDLLPVFDYISGRPYSALSSAGKNPFLESLSPPGSNFLNSLFALSGNSLSATAGFTTAPLTRFEQALGLWADGKPGAYSFAPGDGTILNTSAQISGANNSAYPVEHKDYFRSADVLNQIKTAFSLAGGAVSTEATPHLSSLLAFIIHSPATINILDAAGNPAGINLNSQAVFLANPSVQNYTVRLFGTGAGTFQLEALTATPGGSLRQTLRGTVSAGQAQNIVYAHSPGPAAGFTDDTGDLFLTSLRENSSAANNRSLRVQEALITRLVDNIRQNRSRASAFKQLEAAFIEVVKTLARENNPSVRQKILAGAENLISLMAKLNQLYGTSPDTPAVSREIGRAQQNLVSRANQNFTVLQADNYKISQGKLGLATSLLAAGQNYQAALLARLSTAILF